MYISVFLTTFHHLLPPQTSQKSEPPITKKTPSHTPPHLRSAFLFYDYSAEYEDFSTPHLPPYQQQTNQRHTIHPTRNPHRNPRLRSNHLLKNRKNFLHYPHWKFRFFYPMKLSVMLKPLHKWKCRYLIGNC